MTKSSFHPAGCRATGPSKQTIAILRQFARAYMPAKLPTDIPLVLN